MRASVAAVVVGGSLEVADTVPPRPPASPLAQVEAAARALPHAPVPADMLARQVVHDATAKLAAVATPSAPDCLVSCCLRDDLHLFMPTGPVRRLLAWARLPLPLLYEGGQFSYPLRQVSLPAPLLQLALNGRAPLGWDSCLWHSNLPMLAARSEYTLTLLQLAPWADGAFEGQDPRQQARSRLSAEEFSSDDGREAAQASSNDEWEDDGGGFNLRQLCVVGTRSPTAHTCWQRHLTQQPLLLLEDGTLLEAQLHQSVQVVEAWRPQPGAVRARLRGVLQAVGGAQPRTVLLALRNRLSGLDLRSPTGALSPLWQCPQGQHLTGVCAPLPAGDAPGGATAEHLLAAATGGGQGGDTRVLLFDLRRPGQPVAAWDQRCLGEEGLDAGTLLRWLPIAPPAASVTIGGGMQQRAVAGQRRRGGLLVAGSSSGSQVIGCQYVEQAAGPALQARGGQLQEKPASGAAALLERLQASLEQQQQEQEGQAQQAKGNLAGAPLQAPSVPQPLQPPPTLPLALQLLWQPVHSCVFEPVPPGTPVLLQPPAEQNLDLKRWMEARRQCLQKLSSAAGPSIQASQFEPASQQQRHSNQLAGLAVVAADWAAGQGLPVPLLCSLTPCGDVLLSMLREGQDKETGQQAAATTAPPLLMPVGQQPPDSRGVDDDERLQSMPVAAADMLLLPCVRGVPRAVVAAVLDGILGACGCCKECLNRHSHHCATRAALTQAGLLTRTGEQLGQPEQDVATLPDGNSERSIVQLPLHMALAQRLVQEGGTLPGDHLPADSEEHQTAATALDSILLRLRRSCISLFELEAARQLDRPAEGAQTPSSGSSDDEGGAQAVSSLRRAQQEARRQVRHEWRQRRQGARQALRVAQQAALIGLLEGPCAGARMPDANRRGPAVRTALQQQSGRSQRPATATQHFRPTAAALEDVLQHAKLLLQRPPSGLTRKQQGQQPSQQVQEQREQHVQQASAQLGERALPLAVHPAFPSDHVAAALQRPSARDGAAAAAAALALTGGPGQPVWQLTARNYVLTSSASPAGGHHQHAAPAEQLTAAPHPQVRRAGVAASILSLVSMHHHGDSSPLTARAPDTPTLLADLRAAWD